MELRVLKYFLMVAREENITRAAELLHVTQPTLSRQLAQLERELGVKLFRRGQHSVTLTDDGMLLRRRAQEILALADKTENELSREEGELSGVISIGCGETRSMHELSRLMREFRERNPLVRFEIYTAIADDIKERLDRGVLDLGLLLEPVDISRYDFVRMQSRERWGALCREDSALAQKEAIAPQDLLGEPLIMVKRESVRNELSSWFGPLYDELEIAATYNLIYNAAIMVKNGVGTALSFIFESNFEGLCYRPLSPALESGCVMVWKKQQTFAGATAAFLKFIRNAR